MRSKNTYQIFWNLYKRLTNISGSKKFEDYKSNRQLRDAVERRLEIIGEATNRILKANQAINITKARRIVDMRNKVIHAYDSIDDVTIWAVVINDLPTLTDERKALLKIDL